MKGDPAEDQGGLGGRSDSFAHVGREPWGGTVPRPPPGWRGEERAPIAAAV